MTFLSKLPPEFEFIEDGHRYLLGSRRLTSVTQISDHFGFGPDYRSIPHETIEAAGLRGTALHDLLAWWLGGRVEGVDEVDEVNFTLPARILRDFRAIRSVASDAMFEPWQIEEPVVSTRLGIAGRPDFWGLVYGAPAIVDLKSGDPEGVGFQTAGYAAIKVEMILSTEHLAGIPKEVLKPRRYCLAVSDGRAKLTRLDDPEDEKDFRAAVRIYNRQQRRRE